MDLLRRRRPAIGAGGHAGGQGDPSEGRQGQDQLVQAGETADQALDRLIVEDLRRGALRRSRSVPLPTSGPGLRRLTDAGDETARMGSAGSPDGIPPPPGIAQGQGGQGAPGLMVNPVEGPRPGLGDRGIPGEGAHPGRLGEGATARSSSERRATARTWRSRMARRWRSWGNVWPGEAFDPLAC